MGEDVWYSKQYSNTSFIKIDLPSLSPVETHKYPIAASLKPESLSEWLDSPARDSQRGRSTFFYWSAKGCCTRYFFCQHDIEKWDAAGLPYIKINNHLRFHIFTTMSLPPEPITPYLGLNCTVETKCSWAYTFFFYLPKFKSQIRIVLSSEQEYRYFPLECRDRHLTQLSCPTKLCRCYPVCARNNFISLSLLPVMMKDW